MPRGLPWIVLTFGTLMASGTLVMIKVLTSMASTSEIFLIRFLPASIIAVTILLIFYRDAITTTFRRHWKFFIVRETVALLGFHLTWVYASSILPAGIIQLEIATWPAITMLMASFFLDEKLTPGKIAGGVLAFAGVAAVFLNMENGTSMNGELTSWIWVRTCLVLMIAPISAAVVTIITRKYLIRTDEEKLPNPFIFSLLCRMPAGLIAISVFLLDDPMHLVQTAQTVPYWFWIAMGVISIYNSLIGFWLWNWCIQQLNATMVSSFSHIQTGMTLVLALIFLQESLTPLKIIAALAIVAGVFLTNMGSKKPEPLVEEGGKVSLPE